MCKAGFAGDDAPRAVFRKSRPRTDGRDAGRSFKALVNSIDNVQRLSLVGLAITGKIPTQRAQQSRAPVHQFRILTHR